MIETGRLVGEGTGQPCLAGAGLSGEDDLFSGLDPVAPGERQDLAVVKATAGGEINIFDAGVGEAHPGIAEPVGEALVSPSCGLTVEHESEPFIALERLARVLLGQRLPCVRHACQAKCGPLAECGVCQHLVFPSLGYW